MTTAENIRDATQAFAVPLADTLIDCIRPSTGKSWINGDTLEQVRARYPGAEIVEIADYLQGKAARQDVPMAWAETTGERYWEMLEVLPPACMMGGCFLVGEPWDHHAITGQPRFQAYLKWGGKHWEGSRPMQRSEFVELIARLKGGNGKLTITPN